MRRALQAIACLTFLIIFPAAACSSAGAEETPPARSAATFAGGCFWCMEKPFDELKGVLATTAGYTGGTTESPSYEQVSAGVTGHAEAVRVEFDPSQINYAELLEVFWRNIDPTTAERQFCDRGSQYRSAIFYHDDNQKELAEQSRKTLEKTAKLPGSIVTEISAAGKFYPAEEYHQNYYQKNPLRYRYYRYGCGRDRRLKELWGEAPETPGAP